MRQHCPHAIDQRHVMGPCRQRTGDNRGHLILLTGEKRVGRQERPVLAIGPMALRRPAQAPQRFLHGHGLKRTGVALEPARRQTGIRLKQPVPDHQRLGGVAQRVQAHRFFIEKLSRPDANRCRGIHQTDRIGVAGIATVRAGQSLAGFSMIRVACGQVFENADG